VLGDLKAGAMLRQQMQPRGGVANTTNDGEP